MMILNTLSKIWDQTELPFEINQDTGNLLGDKILSASSVQNRDQIIAKIAQPASNFLWL
jgi:hypothetical protein